MSDGSSYVTPPNDSPNLLKGNDLLREYFPYEETDVWWYVPLPHLLFFYLIGHTRRLVLNPRLPRGTSSDKDAEDTPHLEVIPLENTLPFPLMALDISVCFVGSEKVRRKERTRTLRVGSTIHSSHSLSFLSLFRWESRH